MEKQRVSLDATLIVLDELVAHPDIKTDADKIDFVKNNLSLSDTELHSVLRMTEENPNINPNLLDQTFALTSILFKHIPSQLTKMIRTHASAWEYRTALEAMSKGETEKILIKIHETFE